jgi:hypothetical protein
MKCIFCADTGWVCENHPRRPGKAHMAATAVGPASLPNLQYSRGRRGTRSAGRPQDRPRQRRLAQLSWSRLFGDPLETPKFTVGCRRKNRVAIHGRAAAVCDSGRADRNQIGHHIF